MTRRHWLGSLCLILTLISCDQKCDPPGPGKESTLQKGKAAILLVSHGSRSKRWRDMLLQVETRTRERLLALPTVGGTATAFLEYSEPSVASRLKEFDEKGIDRVLLVLLFLTVSSHSFDDIPCLYGAKHDAATIARFQAEGIEIYSPRARVEMSQELDFGNLLERNLKRRIGKLSQNASEEGVVLIAYGSRTYLDEWEALFARLARNLEKSTGIETWSHGWCGHLVHYRKAPTREAIRRVLAKKQTALVLPVLVAHDPMFQGKIIGGAIEEMPEKDRIRYRPDAILPDPDLEEWIVEAAREFVAPGTGPRTLGDRHRGGEE